jgi:hypothetical protein
MQSASAASAISPSVPSVPLVQLANRTIQTIQRTLSQGGAQPAPNAGNQEPIDVNGEGKEEEQLQPQQGAITLITPQAQPKVYDLNITEHIGIGGQPYWESEEVFSSQSSSSGEIVFGSPPPASQAGAPASSQASSSQASREDDPIVDSEADKQKRARLLQQAIDIETSLMPTRNINNIPPPPGAFTKAGNLTADAKKYLARLVVRIRELQDAGTPLHAIEQFKK